MWEKREILRTSAVSDKPSEWVVGIEKKLEQARADQDHGALAWPKVSIYRIPKGLRSINGNAYIPQMVSLGPYHYGQPQLSGMERHKWRALHQVLKRTGHRIESYLDAVKKMEKDARACYEGPIEISRDKFVEMLLLDSSFILEMLRGASWGFESSLGYSSSDPVFAMIPSMIFIQRDMIMLENQIPLFVLDQIHHIQYPNDARISVGGLALDFFESMVPKDKALPSARKEKADQSGLHCLEVFRGSLLAVREDPKPSPSPVCIKKWFHLRGRSRDKNRQPMIHCVTELKEAGVKFKVKKTDRICDIDFNNGVLEIPRLLVHDGSKCLFLNLIAFEQCHRYCTDEITSYAVFMDNLIDSPTDVAYLHHYRIVDNYLGSNVEVSDLFNSLCHEVASNTNDAELTEKINRYYSHTWNQWRASLMHNYFNNPWTIISFIAAIVLVLLTLAQTFYAAYAYHVRPS